MGVPGRHRGSRVGAAAWAVAAVLARASGQTCDTTAAFPTEQDTQCIGLGADTAARSAIECAQNCCQVADNGCEVWQWKDGGGGGDGCWFGKVPSEGCTGGQGGWTGRRRSKWTCGEDGCSPDDSGEYPDSDEGIFSEGESDGDMF